MPAKKTRTKADSDTSDTDARKRAAQQRANLGGGSTERWVPATPKSAAALVEGTRSRTRASTPSEARTHVIPSARSTEKTARLLAEYANDNDMSVSDAVRWFVEDGLAKGTHPPKPGTPGKTSKEQR